MDLLIPLSNHACQTGDEELRYALRSWCAHYSNLGNVYIAGPYLPDWSQGLLHLPMDDPDPENSDANINRKILSASRLPSISDPFLRADDDQFILQPVHDDSFGPFYCEDLSLVPWTDLTAWGKRMKYTVDLLHSKGLSCFHYEAHVPVVLPKAETAAFIESHLEDTTVKGALLFTLFFNSRETKRRYIGKRAVRILRPYTHPDAIEQLLRECTFLNSAHGAWNPALKKVLQQRFPAPSPFEKETGSIRSS